jgi:uncharacterized protein GlcG (DUF336 family)
MAKLTLSDAQKILEGAIAKAGKLGLMPLTIAVLDDGGHLKAFARQDGPGAALRPRIAIGKAWGSVGMGISSRTLEERAIDRPHFIVGAIAASEGRMVPVAGGVLIRDGSGEIIGAVGISGDSSDNDEASAIAGIEAAGFRTDSK